MANEFKHVSVGIGMTQAEFEQINGHTLNNMATGDLIYAASATAGDLDRLGIGSTNAVLTVIGGVPTWQTTLSGLTFVAPALGAATATSINSLTITTSAGTLTIANNASAALVTSGNYSITLTATAATNVTLPTTGTLATLAGTEELDNKTLDTAVAKGTWTASGTWTLPAITLGGAITGASQNILNTGTIRIGSATAYGGVTPPLEINKTSNHSGIAMNVWSASAHTSIIEFNNARSATPGTYTAAGTGQVLGYIDFNSADGTDWQNAVSIRTLTTGTIGDNRIPGDLRFYIWSDVAASAGILVLQSKADSLVFATSNAAQTAAVTRLTIGGAAATATATWASITHTGMVLSGALDVAGQYITFLERAAPGAGAANEVRVYAIVDGGTLTDLAAVFQDGTVDIFAQEVTPLNAPILTYPSGTIIRTALRKEHPGLVKIVSVFPNGEEFVLKEIEYHSPEKIAANKGTENPLPPNWLVEDDRQRADRLETERVVAPPEIEGEI